MRKSYPRFWKFYVGFGVQMRPENNKMAEAGTEDTRVEPGWTNIFKHSLVITIFFFFLSFIFSASCYTLANTQ